MNTISNERLETIAKNALSEERRMMAAELLALRKEREKVEPVAYMIGGHYLMHANDPKVDNYSSAVPLYTAPPAQNDKPKSEMSQKAEQLLRDTTALAEKLSAEADTTAQQFESLAGKAVGGSEGWKLVPLEPTKEMVAKMRYHNGGYDKHIKNGYAAMLAVAPEPCK
ncbi:hypothetical protein ACU9CR_003732 [Cronobacter dublinensis]